MMPRAILCDLDGVVWRGQQILEENLKRLLAWSRRVPLVFLTNNSTRHHREVETRLRTLGFPHPIVVTSGRVAARALVREGVSRVFLVGEQGLAQELGEVGVTRVEEDAEVVLMGMDRKVCYARLNQAFHELQRGARFWATNDDVTYPAEGLLSLGAGALVATLQAAWGPPEKIFGKPSPEMFLHALDLLGISPSPEVWVIGDRVDTDVEGANRLGLTPVLVLSGVTVSPPDGFQGLVGIPQAP